ncbi:MAG TPA: hypothetical protein VJN94_07185 [Candidatus Binataceae bacterium]|nr:hypothetical protein [Candidatus Binataceae bacterium]
MRLCVGSAKGIILIDPDRGGTPLMVLADPPSVWCMARDCENPNVLYAGSIHNAQAGSARGKGSLARSVDGGRSWNDITPGMARDEEVWSLAAAPDVSGQLFVGTSHARIFRSNDGGRGFQECTAFLKLPGRDRWSFPPPPHIPHVRSIIFDPKRPDTLYVGVEEGGVFRSRDRGESFEPTNHNIYSDVHNLSVDPEDPARLYATTGRGLYISPNSGGSWHYVKGLSRSYTIPILVRQGHNAPIYTAAAAGPPPTWSIGSIGADALMFRSTDRGNSFRPIAAGDGSTHATRGMVMRLLADPENPEVMYGALSDGSLIRVSEREETVSVIAEKLPPAFDLVALP